MFLYCALWAHIICEHLINTLLHYCRETFISVTGEMTSWCRNNKIIQHNSKQCLIQAKGSKICTKYQQASCLHGKSSGNSTRNTLQLQHTCRRKSGPSVRKFPDPASTTFDLHTTADIRRKSTYAATTYHHSPNKSVMITRACLVLVVCLHRPVVCAPRASCVCSTGQFMCAPLASSCVLHRLITVSVIPPVSTCPLSHTPLCPWPFGGGGGGRGVWSYMWWKTSWSSNTDHFWGLSSSHVKGA